MTNREQQPRYLNSLAVANWFIDAAEVNRQIMTAMRLQKLVYLAHGWCLAIYATPLVDERPDALSWGPRFRNIHDATICYGTAPITCRLFTLNGPPSVTSNDPRVVLLARIWDIYGKYTASQLAQIVNEQGGAWDLTWKKDPGRQNMNVDEVLMVDEFKGKMRTESQGA